jgi:hypothetical protein
MVVCGRFDVCWLCGMSCGMLLVVFLFLVVWGVIFLCL